MTDRIVEPPVLACIPAAIPAVRRNRHFRLGQELFTRRAVERRDLDEGYEFRFSRNQFEDVAHFVADECRCCPFLAFDLSIAPDSGPLWLRITGPAGTRALLDTELLSANECGCKPGSPRDPTVTVGWAAAGAVVTSVGVCAACCLLPAALIALGVGSSLVGTLDSLTPYRGWFVAVTGLLLGYGFRSVYGRGARNRPRRSTTAALWLATALALSGIVYGLLEPHLSGHSLPPRPHLSSAQHVPPVPIPR